MKVADAVKKLEGRGALLVYPLQNRSEPASLWSEFYPKSKMRWEWDSGSDARVAGMWRLREEISRSGRAVYAKWFQNRATFFSLKLFPYFVAALNVHEGQLSPAARKILQILEEDSPLSTKELKKRADLVGKSAEAEYDKATKELWRSLFIVGYGEIDDGAFPSLAIGATSLLFNSQWKEAQKLNPNEAQQKLVEVLGEESPFYKYFLKVRMAPAKSVAKGKLTGVLRYEDLIKK